SDDEMKRRRFVRSSSLLEEQIKLEFHNSEDLKQKTIQLDGLTLTLLYLDDISDRMVIQKTILSPLLTVSSEDTKISPTDIPDLIPMAAVNNI
ncbi:hypothetical protein R0J91_15570, partial [Micrococcus sp. SIMBA_131]